MCDEKRFTIVAVMIPGLGDRYETSIRLHTYLRKAYRNSKTGDTFGPDNKETGSPTPDWVGLYVHDDPEVLLKDIGEYIDDYEIDPDKILVILGDISENIESPKNMYDFIDSLEEHVKLGVNVVLTTTRDYGLLSYNYSNVGVFALNPQDIINTKFGDDEDQPFGAKSLRRFIEVNF